MTPHDQHKKSTHHVHANTTKLKEMRHVEYLNNYKDLKATIVTSLPKHRPSRIVNLRLTGSMERYVWNVNDIPMYASDEILIKKGENVKFILINETMMHHPIHLHGHFFRVLNGQGDYSPLKHTVNVAPFETVEIEFSANEEKDWIFHCHNLYHMKLGMGGTIRYEDSKHKNMHKNDSHLSEHGNAWFRTTKLEGYSNFADATTKLTHTDHAIAVDAKHNYKRDYDSEVTYEKYISQFLGIYVGGKFERDKHNRSNRGIVGFNYILPLLIKADVRVNTKGRGRFGLSNEHQLTDRVSFDWKWNTDKEYFLSLSYAITKHLYLSSNYDSKERFGVGLNIKF